MNLKNKVAWITGGARMGEAVGDALSQLGCGIAFTYRTSRKPADAMVQKINAKGGQAMALQCDLTQRSQIETAVQTIYETNKRLDILINLSSIYEEASITDINTAAASWKAHLSANAESAYALCVATAPWMKKNGEGRIILVSDWTSASGRPRYKNYSAYYVSKSAIKAVAESMALELAPKILVNAIAPGPMIPPPGLTEQELSDVEKSTPLQRWGGAEELAKAVLFLVQTDFVTGETIRVDGGRHLN